MILDLGDGWRVRPLRLEDAGALFEVLSDPETMRYVELPFSRERTERFIREAGMGEPPMVYALADARDVCRGHVIWHAQADGFREIGWILHPAARGRGLARRITGALIERARAEGAPGCLIECAPEQAISRRVAEALGFAPEEERDGLFVWRLRLS